VTDNSTSRDWPAPAAGTRLDEEALRLPRPPGALRRFWARHPRATDILIALAYLLPAVGFTLLTAVVPGEPNQPIPLVIAGLVVLALGAGALLFRRSRPWLPVIAAVVATLVAAPLLQVADIALIPFAIYGLAIYGSTRAAWVAYAIAVPVSTLAYVLGGPARGQDNSGLVQQIFDGGVPAAVSIGIVVLIATNIGNRRRYVAALIDRAARLEREREQLAQLAALDERSRIAREMHDIVSHSLTVMVTLAEGSAAIAPDDSDRAIDGMRRVAETGRSALTDMRRMLGVLTEGESGADSSPAELAPQPGVGDLGELVERFRTAGLPVSLETRGQQPADPSTQLTIYRIVQESLTNALKHAVAPSVVSVDVRFRRSLTTITIADDGASTAEPGTGHGLVGMRERVALYGGTLKSGTTSGSTGGRTGGGWTVTATLPQTRSHE